MLLNLLLLLLLFGAQKKKVSPYLAGLLLGVIKLIFFAVFTRNLAWAVIMGVAYAGLGTAFVYFLRRLDQREDRERPEVPAYRPAGADKMKFRWEYFPLVILLILIVWGEPIVVLLSWSANGASTTR